jgi:hypothetical protein
MGPERRHAGPAAQTLLRVVDVPFSLEISAFGVILPISYWQFLTPGSSKEMDKAEFWEIIDKSRQAAGGDPYQQLETLGDLLREISPDEIVSFDYHFSAYHARAYTWDLWGAAYVIGGGCSDDGFMDFRGWLISRGEKVYEAAMANADSLAAVVEEHDLRSGKKRPANHSRNFPRTTCQWAEKFKARPGKRKTWMPASLNWPRGSTDRRWPL